MDQLAFTGRWNSQQTSCALSRSLLLSLSPLLKTTVLTVARGLAPHGLAPFLDSLIWLTNDSQRSLNVKVPFIRFPDLLCFELVGWIFQETCRYKWICFWVYHTELTHHGHVKQHCSLVIFPKSWLPNDFSQCVVKNTTSHCLLCSALLKFLFLDYVGISVQTFG